MALRYYRSVQFSLRSLSTGGEEPWQPRADVYCCDDACIVKLELAGIRPEDIRVELRLEGLVVSGVRRDWFVNPTMQCHLMEIPYSHFERVVPLPENFRSSRIAVEYQDGMLIVRLLQEAQQQP